MKHRSTFDRETHILNNQSWGVSRNCRKFLRKITIVDNFRVYAGYQVINTNITSLFKKQEEWLGQSWLDDFILGNIAIKHPCANMADVMNNGLTISSPDLLKAE